MFDLQEPFLLFFHLSLALLLSASYLFDIFCNLLQSFLILFFLLPLEELFFLLLELSEWLFIKPCFIFQLQFMFFLKKLQCPYLFNVFWSHLWLIVFALMNIALNRLTKFFIAIFLSIFWCLISFSNKFCVFLWFVFVLLVLQLELFLHNWEYTCT